MKFTATAFVAAAAASFFTFTAALPLSEKRDATSILDVLGPVESEVSSILYQLEATNISTDTVNSLIGDLTQSLSGLTTSLTGLAGQPVETLLGGASNETVAQRVGGLLNSVTGTLSKLEGTLGTALPVLQGPITTLNGVLQGVLNTSVGLVNGLNSILTPLLTPVTGILKGLGLNLNLGLLGLRKM